MQLKHLTDEEIQDYLDGNLSGEIALSIKGHLEVCQHCREALKQYQSVYVGLEDDKGFELSRGFAKTVVRRLPAEADAKSRFGFLNLLMEILGFVAAIGGTLYFVDLRPLARAFSHILPGPQLGSGLLDFVKGLLVGLNGNIGLLIFALLTLALIAGMDRLFFQPKHRRIQF
jgi:anti-sigma factor RsiW